jgi:nitroreductase
MDLSDVIKKRRSIRQYKKDDVDIKLIKQCIEAAVNAPSARNSQPWHFIVVKDKKKREQLSKTHGHSNFIADAPVIVTVLAEEEKSPGHYVMDCSAAIMLFLLKATELGLATCWTDASTKERDEHVQKVLDLPSKYRVICNIAVGYPDGPPNDKTLMTFEEAADVIE